MAYGEWNVIAVDARRTDETAGDCVYTGPTRLDCMNWITNHVSLCPGSQYLVVRVTDVYDISLEPVKLPWP